LTGGIASDYIIANAPDLAIQYGALNEGRLPAYHRLDINLRRTFDFSEGMPGPARSLEVSAGVTNVYSRENVFYINRVTGERVDQLPFLPTIGLDWAF
jgi:hypothetical protein